MWKRETRSMQRVFYFMTSLSLADDAVGSASAIGTGRLGGNHNGTGLSNDIESLPISETGAVPVRGWCAPAPPIPARHDAAGGEEGILKSDPVVAVASRDDLRRDAVVHFELASRPLAGRRSAGSTSSGAPLQKRIVYLRIYQYSELYARR